MQQAKEFKKEKPNYSPIISDKDTLNPTFDIQAFWRPVSFRNYFIVLGIMIALVLLNYWGKYLFNKEKWSNSNNSPFSEYNN